MRAISLLLLPLILMGCSKSPQSPQPKLAILNVRKFAGDEAGHRDEVIAELKQMLKTPKLINDALKSPELANDALADSEPEPARWLANNIQTYAFDDGTFAVSLPMAPQNAKTAELINALTYCMLDEYAQDHREKMAIHIRELQQTKRAIKKKLKKLEEESPERREVERMAEANQMELNRLQV